MPSKTPKKVQARQSNAKAFAASRGSVNARRRVLAPVADAALKAALQGFIEGDYKTVHAGAETMRILCKALYGPGGHSQNAKLTDAGPVTPDLS